MIGSLGGGGMGGGSGGGSGGGGRMLWTVRRAVRAGGSGGAGRNPSPTSTTSSRSSRKTYKLTTDNLSSLYSVPSKDEVLYAVSALKEFLNRDTASQLAADALASDSDEDVADEITTSSVLTDEVSSVGSDLDWIEPSIQLCSPPRMLHPYGSDSVYDAFHLLQTDPCIQRMVVSLSTDKAVWNAVMNNEVVRELRESLSGAAGKGVLGNQDVSSGGSNAAMNILSWIFNNTRAKVLELIETITKLFQPSEDNMTTGDTTGDADLFEEKVRSAVVVTVVVLLIVVVTRAALGA